MRSLSWLVLAAALGSAPPRSAADPADDATTRWSKERLFKVSYESSPRPVPLLALNAWTLTVVDRAEAPVGDAKILVFGGMPEHTHGLPTVPQVKPLGGGKYLVEGLKFHMPGRWTVGFRIRAGAVTDSVTFNLRVE